MRDYAGYRAHQRESSEIFPKLARIVRNWFARRAFRELDRLDDFILRDIGLSRGDVDFVPARYHDTVTLFAAVSTDCTVSP